MTSCIRASRSPRRLRARTFRRCAATPTAASTGRSKITASLRAKRSNPASLVHAHVEEIASWRYALLAMTLDILLRILMCGHLRRIDLLAAAHAAPAPHQVVEHVA